MFNCSASVAPLPAKNDKGLEVTLQVPALSAACLLILPLLCAPALTSLLLADEFSTGSVYAFSLRQSRSAAAGCGCDV